MQASRDSIAPAPAPRKFDQPPTYKWLLNVDPSGSSLLPSNPAYQTEQNVCHPKTSTYPTGNALYPGPDPRYSLNFPANNPPGISQADISAYGATHSSLANLDDPTQPANPCNWSSIHQLTSSPVVSTGNQGDWNGTTPLPLWDGTRGLKDGNYLISVTSDGYQIGGTHFSVVKGAFTGPIVVNLNPWPIPLGTIKLKAFADMASSNGQWDEQTEPGLPGFVANLNDYDGKVTVDYYGNPLCTAYKTNAAGLVMLGINGKPTVDPLHHWLGSGLVDGPSTGACVSDSNGDITIPNMAPNRYGASLIPPSGSATVASVSGPVRGAYSVALSNVDSPAGLPPGGTFNVTTGAATQQITCTGRTGDTLTGCRGAIAGIAVGNPVSTLGICPVSTTAPAGSCWVQTTTLEGNHDFDVWPLANDTGVDTELVVGGEPVPFVHFGYTLAGCLTSPLASIDPANYVGPSVCGGNFSPTSTAAGAVKGKIMGADSYFPGIGGLPGTQGNVGVSGYKFEREVKHGWVALSDLSNNDKTVYTAPANADGTFQISHVPDGSYSLSIWDQPQDYIYDSVNVDVVGGKMVDEGVLPLLPWFTRIDGHVCIDTNGNGKCDPGEAGIPEFTVQNLNRTNNGYEQGQGLAKTNDSGYYEFTEAYPLGSMNVIQAFNTRWKTVGVTWQACNDPKEHTTLTPIVDVSYQPIISQCGRLDWALQPYKASAGENGGIVATVLNTSVRNRFLGRQQVAYDHFTGIPGVMTELFTPVKGTGPGGQADNGFALNADGSYEIADPTGHPTSAYTAANRTVDANPNAYVTEHYGRPTGCVAQDANGNVIQGSLATDGSGTVQGTPAGNLNTVTDFLPGVKADNSQPCLETPATGVAFGLGTDNNPIDPANPSAGNHGVQTVDGNYALTPAAPGDYLTKVDIPTDTVLPPVAGVDRPLYKLADESSLNNFDTQGNGLGAYDAANPAQVPQFVPQNADLVNVYNGGGAVIAPNADGAGFDWGSLSTGRTGPSAGPPSQVPVAVATPGGESPSSFVEDPNTAAPAPDPQCAGAIQTVNVTDPTFKANGGSPLQGLARNACDIHLIHVGAGQSVAPNFYLYTDVPLPTMFQIQNFDDTNLSTTKTQTQYGDAAPMANSAEGVYDWAGNQVDAAHTDPNGITEALMPSTDVANCTTPAGICQNTYRFVGNDPGTPSHPNANFNSQYQTITANFQALPGIYEPADTAPTRSAIQFINSGQKFTGAASCSTTLGARPQFFAVDKPFATLSTKTATGTTTPVSGSIDIRGTNFGPLQAGGAVTLTGGAAPISLPVTFWSDSEIKVTVPATTLGGQYQLTVNSAAGGSTLNGLSYYVINAARTPAYQPPILEVGPQFTTEATTLGGLGSSTGWTGQRQFPSIQEAIERAAGFWLRPVGGSLIYTPEPARALPGAIVVVYPNTPTTFAPLGPWYEPIVMHSAVRVQGVGPGGVIPGVNGAPDTAVPGTIIDNSYYFANLDNTVSPPAAIDWATAGQDVKAQHGIDVWQTVATAAYAATPVTDNQLVTEGQGVTVLARRGQAFTPALHPALDGVTVTNGIVENTPANVNANTGTHTGPAPAPDATQGGAIFLNGHDEWTQITNDVVKGNQGSYGAIRIGTPQLDNQHNWNVELGHDQITANGGNNLGGGLAIFNDAGGYNVHDNLICGNQSAEYGGGVSQYGLSIAPVTYSGTLNASGARLVLTSAAATFTGADIGHAVSGAGLGNARIVADGLGHTNPANFATPHSVTLSALSPDDPLSPNLGAITFRYIPSLAAQQTASNLIDHNIITLNQAIDEGGGIMIAGQLPTDSTKPSAGAGPVTITRNVVAVNMANDDGGGIRFLQAGNFPMRVAGNMITNNVSSHEGGGISIDDTPQVTIINDTIAKNLTTATAATSNGTPAPAGISTAKNSLQMQATLPAGSPLYSNPVIVNDIIWDNRAGSWSPTSGVVGIGLTGDTTAINRWDVGSVDNVGLLTPVDSVLSSAPGAQGQGYTQGPGDKINVDPNFLAAFDLQLDVAPLRTYFRLRPAAIVNVTLPANGFGDYHIQGLGVSSAEGIGTLIYPGTTGLLLQAPFSTPIAALAADIDGDAIPSAGGKVDAGADQLPASQR